MELVWKIHSLYEYQTISHGLHTTQNCEHNRGLVLGPLISDLCMKSAYLQSSLSHDDIYCDSEPKSDGEGDDSNVS